MKIHPVGAKLFHAGGQADGQTNMTKLRVAFHDFVNMPKNREVHGMNKSIDLYRQLQQVTLLILSHLYFLEEDGGN